MRQAERVRARRRIQVYTLRVSRRRPNSPSNYHGSPSPGARLQESRPHGHAHGRCSGPLRREECGGTPAEEARCQVQRGPLKRLLAAALALASCGFGPLSVAGAALGLLGRDLLLPLPNARRGVRWANVAVLVGLLNSTLWVGAWTWFKLQPESAPIEAARGFMPLVTQRTTTKPLFPDFPELETLPAAEEFTATGPVRGAATEPAFRVTDMPASVESLGAALRAHAAEAAREGAVPLVWLVSADCDGCRRLSGRLGAKALKDIMAHVSIARVDAERFESELVHLRFPVEPLPGFVRVSAEGLPLDFVDGREWTYGRSSFTQVMTAFVRGQLVRRRHPWRGGLRADEMPI